MHAPVVQNLWYVMDASRAFGQAQNEVVILASFKPGAKASDGFHEIATIHAKVTRIHA